MAFEASGLIFGTSGITLSTNASPLFGVTGAGLFLSSGSTPSGSGGTLVLTAPEYLFPQLTITGSLTSNLTIQFPDQQGMWLVYFGVLTLNGFSVSVKAGAGGSPLLLGTISTGLNDAALVNTYGTGLISAIQG
jgi:hypothetical protein